jgi:hypothetical protein
MEVLGLVGLRGRMERRPQRGRGIADRDDDQVEANSVRHEIYLVIEGGSAGKVEFEHPEFTGQKKLSHYGEENNEEVNRVLSLGIYNLFCSHCFGTKQASAATLANHPAAGPQSG